MNDHRNAAWVQLEETALAAARRGWRVLPLQVGRITPAVRDWYQRATTDAERIRRCWAAGAFNVGLVPCPSGLLIVDLMHAPRGQRPPSAWRLPGIRDGADVLAAVAERHGRRMPTETYTVRTPYGGIHLYFTHPGQTCPPATRGNASPLGWRTRLLTTGCCVPAAGTHTPDGPYTLIHDTDPAPLPAWLAALLPTAPAEPGRKAAS